MNYKKYLWYIPALYVAYMFGDKIIEGLAHSQEFIDIFSVIPLFRGAAYTLTPLIGIFDLFIALALLLNPIVTRNQSVQKFLFAWVIVWPFLPASVRYFGGVAEFELIEVLSISLAGLISCVLWRKFVAMA